MNLMELRSRPHLSASQINQLLNICSLQWYFERMAKLKKPFVSHSLVFGSCVHRVLESCFTNLKEGKPLEIDKHKEMFSDHWKKENERQTIKFPVRDDYESLADKGRNMIECFMENTDPDEKVLSVSHAFCVPVRSPDGAVIETPLIGEYDMVVERAGVSTVVDWKTAARKWATGQAHKSFQATVYSYAWNQMHGVRPEIRFDVVTKTKEPSFESHTTKRSENMERRMGLLISKAQKIIEHELFYPSETGFYCNDCPFKEPCKAWHLNGSCTASQAA